MVQTVLVQDRDTDVHLISINVLLKQHCALFPSISGLRTSLALEEREGVICTGNNCRFRDATRTFHGPPGVLVLHLGSCADRPI